LLKVIKCAQFSCEGINSALHEVSFFMDGTWLLVVPIKIEVGIPTSDVVETVTFETETWLKFRDETETSSKTPRSRPRRET